MALSGIECPQMHWDGDNLKENWRRFKQHVELMFSGPLKSRQEAKKCSYLLIWVGEKGRDIYNTWTGITDGDKSKLKTYYDLFEADVSPRANPVLARFKFHGRVQGSSETAEKFITDLRILAQDCDFKDPDEMIRDRIVFGTNSPKVREKLISKGSALTLDKAVELARSFEASQAQLSAMAGSSTNNSEETVPVVQKQNTGKGPQGAQPSNSQPPRGTRLCGNCGRSHNSLSNCPARSQTGLYCKKPNHFAEVCRSKARRQRFHSLEQAGSQASQTKAESTLSAAFELVVFESITIAGVSLRETSRYRDEVFVSINLNLPQDTHKNTILKAKLDTGAQSNILPMRLYRQMYPHNLDDHRSLRPVSSSDVILTAYGGSQIKHHGTVTIPCFYRGENARASFYVTDNNRPPDFHRLEAADTLLFY